MAIRISHTPYGAVGGLAEHAGQAQQAVREQQIAEQEAEQARSIAAQKEMQATQIGAAREEWQQKLTTQQEQFAMSQAAQQEQVFRQQQASEFATMKQAQVQRAQITAQQEQFEQQQVMQQQQMIADQSAREQSFELQQAQEARLLQSAQATTQAAQMRSAFDFKKLEASKTDIATGLAEWENVRDFISPEEYSAGKIALSLGKMPRLRAETDDLIRRKRELDIEKKELAATAGLTDRGRTVAQEVFEDVFGEAAGKIAGAWTGMSEAELIDNYKSYQTKVGYAGKNDASKRELDNVFDRSVIDYENRYSFDYYSAWDPESKAVENLRVQSKGVIGDTKANEYFLAARLANPSKSNAEVKTIAINKAISEGWEL